MDSAECPMQPQQPYSLSSTTLIAVGVCEPPRSYGNCLVNNTTLNVLATHWKMGYLEETHANAHIHTHTSMDEHLCANADRLIVIN